MASVKVSQVRDLMNKFADALEKNKADAIAVRGIRDLSVMFAGSEENTTAALFKTIAQLSPPASIPEGGPLIGSVIPALDTLRTLVNDVAKKDLNQSLDAFLVALRANSNVPIAVFTANVLTRPVPNGKSKTKARKDAVSVDDRLIDDYAKKLEAVLGDDAQFIPLFEELCADERVAQAEAVAIASRFYGRTPESTRRPKALERVRDRHVKLMKFKRQRSTSERSAA